MLLRYFSLILFLLSLNTNAKKYYASEDKLRLREQVRDMFYHAYDNYLHYAYDYDELRPLTCDGVDTWGGYSLTLIDALDTLAIMGNYTEFRRVSQLLQQKLNFDRDINVSVFETNIRVVGGLLSAHLLAKRAGIAVETGWPCQGPLLRLAENLAKRLLPAFDTATGMPYGTVNLRYGVPSGETPVTCTAGVGTFLIEFGTLSRLTGNKIYEDVALNAVYALWERRSPLGLFGNHIDVQTGRWTALDSGIGAGVDSLFEYLVKAATLLNRPHLFTMFQEAKKQIDKHIKRDDWYVWVNMNKGQVTLPVFQSLEAFWPGVLSTIGDTTSAMRTIVKYVSVWKKYGFLPEFFNIATMQVSANRESYPLRPELAESLWYLYRATDNHFLLEAGETMIHTINFSARTKCGYATIRNVVTHEKENRMESFFLAETTKYLYLLFDEHNFMHNQGIGELLEIEHGVCAVNAGAYIFNTEAHPVDMSALYCCHDLKEDIFDALDLNQFSNDVLLQRDREDIIKEAAHKMEKYECQQNVHEKQSRQAQRERGELSVDIEVHDEDNQPVGDLLVNNFAKIAQSVKQTNTKLNESADNKQQEVLVVQPLTMERLQQFFAAEANQFLQPTQALDFVKTFMRSYAWDTDDDAEPETLWEDYLLQQQLATIKQLAKQFDLNAKPGKDFDVIKDMLVSLRGGQQFESSTLNDILDKITAARSKYERMLVNTTAMQEFLQRAVFHGEEQKKQPVSTYNVLLTEQQISSLPLPQAKEDLLRVLVRLQDAVELKLRLQETLERLQEVIENPIKLNAVDTADVVENANKILTIENIENKEKDNEVENNTKQDKNDERKASVWQQLVQTILRNTITQPQQFDEKQLHEKIQNSIKKYKNAKFTEDSYAALTCPRLAYWEEFCQSDYYFAH